MPTWSQRYYLFWPHAASRLGMGSAPAITDIYAYADQNLLSRDLLLIFVDLHLLPAFNEYQESKRKRAGDAIKLEKQCG